MTNPLIDIAQRREQINDLRNRQELAIADAYKEDATLTLKALAGAADMTEEGVRQLLRRRGVQLRSRGGRRRPAVPVIVVEEGGL